MSRTYHPRPRRVRGHRREVRTVHMYDGTVKHQSHCSCGAVGPLRDTWAPANGDSRDHLREPAGSVQS